MNLKYAWSLPYVPFSINFIAIVFEGDLLNGKYNYTVSCISNSRTNIRKLPVQTNLQS